MASAGKHAWLQELGADVTIDYTDPNAFAALADHPVQVALNLASGSRDTALAAVKAGGVMGSLGEGADAVSAAAAAAGVRPEATHVHTNRHSLEQVGALAAEGVLRPVVSRVLDLADATEAHRAIESGHTQGKIVLRAWTRRPGVNGAGHEAPPLKSPRYTTQKNAFRAHTDV